METSISDNRVSLMIYLSQTTRISVFSCDTSSVLGGMRSYSTQLLYLHIAQMNPICSRGFLAGLGEGLSFPAFHFPLKQFKCSLPPLVVSFTELCQIVDFSSSCERSNFNASCLALASFSFSSLPDFSCGFQMFGSQ